MASAALVPDTSIISLLSAGDISLIVGVAGGGAARMGARSVGIIRAEGIRRADDLQQMVELRVDVLQRGRDQRVVGATP